MDEALYGDGGFYARGGGAGRGGHDFLTSPEVGPLFGACLARALDAEWRSLDEPAVFVVVEAGAGAGALCRSVLAAAPDCVTALRYLLVERSPVLRARAAASLEVEPPAQVLAPTTPGPVVAILDDLPAGPLVGAVVANELLDNLPPVLARRRHDGGWDELRVGFDRLSPERTGGTGRSVGWVAAPAAASVSALARRHAPDAPAGAVIPLQGRAGRWVQQARTLLEAGRVTCIDYADTTASMGRRPVTEWLRTYRDHGPGGDPLGDLGGQDVTCEVAVDQLAPDTDVAQADWLRAHGLDGLFDAARQAWMAAAAAPDIEALKSRSRMGEAAALTDPSGLGAFRVMEWLIR